MSIYEENVWKNCIAKEGGDQLVSSGSLDLESPGDTPVRVSLRQSQKSLAEEKWPTLKVDGTVQGTGTPDRIKQENEIP